MGSALWMSPCSWGAEEEVDKSQGVRRWGQLATAAMGTGEEQGPLGSPTRGLWSLGWVQSEAGTSRASPALSREAASILTAEGTSFLPVLFPWKPLAHWALRRHLGLEEDLLPQRGDQGDGSVVIPSHFPQICPEPRQDRPYVPLAPPRGPPGQQHHKSPAWSPCPASSEPRASSPLTHR